MLERVRGAGEVAVPAGGAGSQPRSRCVTAESEAVAVAGRQPLEGAHDGGPRVGVDGLEETDGDQIGLLAQRGWVVSSRRRTTRACCAVSRSMPGRVVWRSGSTSFSMTALVAGVPGRRVRMTANLSDPCAVLEGSVPKKKNRRTPRPAPTVRHRRAAVQPVRDEGWPALLTDVARALTAPHPEALLALVSSLLAAIDPRGRDPFAHARAAAPDLPTLGELADSFLQVPGVETTALLTVVAEVTDDDLLVRRVRRELATRPDRLPGWLERLAPVTVDRAVVFGHVLGDGENVILAARTGSRRPLTVIVYIDHNLGTLVKDGFIVPEPIEATLASLRRAAGDDPDTRIGDLDLADARARITEAIDLGAITVPPLETGTWPAARPLVEWVVRHLPSGGTGYTRPEYPDRDREALTETFFASKHAAGLTAQDRDLFASLLWFGCDYGPGDPLRWSPVAVEILLTDWLPRKVIADAAFLSRAPAVLRALIRHSHEVRGIRPALTRQTLTAVDRLAPAYQRTIRTPRPQGPAALLHALGVLDPRQADEALAVLADIPDYDEQVLDGLREAVGDALDTLDDTPLPDEPLNLARISSGLHHTLTEIADLTDRCCADLLDSEHATACRRLLRDIAARADVFRRGRPDTAAAGIVWIIAKANHTFNQRPGGLTAKAVGDWFGLGSNAAQRAPTLLQALAVPEQRYRDVRLRSPRYLTAARRRAIIDTRDRHQRHR